MYGQWVIAVGAVMSVFAVIVIGIAARRAGWLSEAADQSLLRLIMRVLFPCLIFSAVSDNPALRNAGNLVLPPIIGFFTVLLGFAAAMLVTRLGRRFNGLGGSGQRRTFVVSVGFYNYSFVPIPLVKLLFDDDTLGVLFVHNVGAGLAVYTIGVMLLSRQLGGRWWQRMLNGPSIAILVALAFNFLGGSALLPEFLARAIDWLGQAAIPMSLVAIGAITADQFQPDLQTPRNSGGVKVMAWSCLLRLCLLPVVTLVIAGLLPASLELKRVLVVIAAMPAATFSIILARHYGGAPGIALRVALCTSIVGLITIPIWLSLGVEWIGLEILLNP